MKIEFEIDEKEYGFIAPDKLKKAFTALNILYGKIWTEAKYDPKNDEWQAFARTLLPLIEEANEYLEFKK